MPKPEIRPLQNTTGMPGCGSSPVSPWMAWLLLHLPSLGRHNTKTVSHLGMGSPERLREAKGCLLQSPGCRKRAGSKTKRHVKPSWKPVGARGEGSPPEVTKTIPHTKAPVHLKFFAENGNAVSSHAAHFGGTKDRAS